MTAGAGNRSSPAGMIALLLLFLGVWPGGLQRLAEATFRTMTG